MALRVREWSEVVGPPRRPRGFELPGVEEEVHLETENKCSD